MWDDNAIKGQIPKIVRCATLFYKEEPTTIKAGVDKVLTEIKHDDWVRDIKGFVETCAALKYRDKEIKLCAI